MAIAAAGFDWDAGNRDKCQQHGLSIVEVESMFLQPVSIFPDPAHSETEERFKAFGRSTGGRHILLVFTLRKRGGESQVRPISARYMH